MAGRRKGIAASFDVSCAESQMVTVHFIHILHYWQQAAVELVTFGYCSLNLLCPPASFSSRDLAETCALMIFSPICLLMNKLLPYFGLSFCFYIFMNSDF